MDQAVTTPSAHSASSSAATLDRLAPYMLSVLRIMAALLFLQHGLSKYFGFPQAMDPFPLFSLLWFAALIELAGGILVALGLFTRIAAFIMSGQMAVGLFSVSRAAIVLSHLELRRCGGPLLLRVSLFCLFRRGTAQPRCAVVERAALNVRLSSKRGATATTQSST